MNQIVGFWRWFFTPHFGSKKWLKCKRCNSKRHYMVRVHTKFPSWVDLPW